MTADCVGADVWREAEETAAKAAAAAAAEAATERRPTDEPTQDHPATNIVQHQPLDCPQTIGRQRTDKNCAPGTHPSHCYLFCSLAVLNPRVGHTMDVLSPFISVLCHSD